MEFIATEKYSGGEASRTKSQSDCLRGVVMAIGLSLFMRFLFLGFPRIFIILTFCLCHFEHAHFLIHRVLFES